MLENTALWGKKAAVGEPFSNGRKRRPKRTCRVWLRFLSRRPRKFQYVLFSPPLRLPASSFKGPRRCPGTPSSSSRGETRGRVWLRPAAAQRRSGFQSRFPGRAPASHSRAKRRCPQPSPPAFAWPPGLLQGGGPGKAALQGGRPCGASPEGCRRPLGKRAPVQMGPWGNSNHATPPDGEPRLAASSRPAQKRRDPRSARRHQLRR